MTLDEFNKLTLSQKWLHVKLIMDYILGVENLFTAERVLTPHHLPSQAVEERRRLRLEQYQRWEHVKTLYSVNRDEMVDTLDIDEYSSCKDILERVINMEVDDALRGIIGEN
jgi:hypothetical protein